MKPTPKPPERTPQQQLEHELRQQFTGKRGRKPPIRRAAAKLLRLLKGQG
jgi:hypothetical protein